MKIRSSGTGSLNDLPVLHGKMRRTDEDELKATTTEEEVPSLLWNAEVHRHVVK